MLSQKQKIAVRRHLGVPFAGTAQAGRLFGWRFEMHVEDLEYRMNNMQAPEEQLLTGISLGSYRIDGNPKAGDALGFNVNDGTNNVTVPYAVQGTDITQPINGSPSFTIANNAALAFNRSALYAAGYQAIAVQPADLFVSPMFPSYYSELLVVGPTFATFALSGTAVGNTNLVVEASGTPSPVQATIGTTTYYGYIAICDQLAMQMATPNLSLTYEKADIVTFRKDEIRARRAQYREYCMQMSSVMGGKEYLQKFGGGSAGGATA